MHRLLVCLALTPLLAGCDSPIAPADNPDATINACAAPTAPCVPHFTPRRLGNLPQ
jgi:hypothetical protein